MKGGSEKMFCPECGKNIEKGTIFCPHCGTRIIEETEKPSQASKIVEEGKVGRKKSPKKFSPVVYGIIIFCFLLPFVKVSCQNQKIAEVSGIQLITGFKIEQPSMFEEKFEEKKEERVNPQPLIIIPFICALIGFCFSFVRKRKISIIPGIGNIIGMISLFIFKSKMDTEALKGGGLIQVNYGIGYWLVLLFFIFMIIIEGIFIFQKGKVHVPISKEKPATQNIYCPQCGSKNSLDASFCTNCGEKLIE